MRVLFDTNVLIDIWGKSSDFEYSFTAYDVAVFSDFECVISTAQVSDFLYLLMARGHASKKRMRDELGNLLEAFDVIDVVQADCVSAQKGKMDDLEDALIAYAAKRNSVDLIVTRDKRDFKRSPVPAVSPQEFVDIYKPACLEYEMVDLD